MASRYEKVISLDRALYQENCDVIVSAGALLKDNKENKYVVQLKMQNTSSKVIKSVDVKIVPLDVSGVSLDCPVEFSYLDFTAGRGDCFGDRNAISIEDSHIRNFALSITRIIYNDNSIVELGNAQMIPLPEQRELTEIFNEDLIAQYILSTSPKSKYEPMLLNDKYLCSCGTVFNRKDEDACFSCGVRATTSYKLFDHDYLAKKAAKANEDVARKTQEKKRITQEKQLILEEISSLREDEIETDELSELKGEIIKLQEEYNHLGLFKNAEKKALKERIDSTDQKYAKALDAEKQKRKKKIAELQKKYRLLISDRFQEFLKIKDSFSKKGSLSVDDYSDDYDDYSDDYDDYDDYSDDYPTVEFGHYPQDSNKSVVWSVVKVDGFKMMLVSKYGIEIKQFHSDRLNPTWENSDIRKWLNGEFYSTAFDIEETEIIKKTNVPAHKNPEYPKVEAGNDTSDHVFLLSIAEADEIFPNDEARKCRPTKRIEEKLADSYAHQSLNGTNWWLRSPGRSHKFIAIPKMQKQQYKGAITGEGGVFATAPDIMVRPVIWIEL